MTVAASPVTSPQPGFLSFHVEPKVAYATFELPLFMPEFTDDDWLTPPELLKLFGGFDLDPCSPVIRPWDTAARHFTINDDGLLHEWHGRAWLNPPYSKVNGKSQVELWLAKMASHANGMALTNARTETQWFSRFIWDAATAVVFPKGRLKFLRPNGCAGDTGKSASVIAAFSHADAEILFAAKSDGQYAPLRNGKFIPLAIKITANFRTSWRRLIRWLLRECGGVATLEQIYEMACDHPKTLQNPNWKAKLRQQVQREAVRVGPALWQLRFQQPTLI